jgi:hypothetical protein
MRPCHRDSAARRCSAPQQAQRSGQNRNRDRSQTSRRLAPTNTTTVYHYTMPLPLVPALLTDAWASEVVLRLRLRRALRRLVAALTDCEVRP